MPLNNCKASIWVHEKVKKAFLKLCQKAFEPRVNWKRFRKLDKNAVFGGYTNAQLSMKFRKLWLIENGICYYCGENEPEEGRSMCRECLDKMGEYAAQHRERKKEDD